jgi:ferredoxin
LIDPKRGGRLYDRLGPMLNYLQRKSVPVPACDTTQCDLCGNCVFECPSKNITVVNKTIAIADDCIYCYRCWQVCPNDAIVAKFSPGNGFFDRLVYSETVERWFGDVQAGEHAGENRYREAMARTLRLRYDRKHPTGEITAAPPPK